MTQKEIDDIKESGVLLAMSASITNKLQKIRSVVDMRMKSDTKINLKEDMDEVIEHAKDVQQLTKEYILAQQRPRAAKAPDHANVNS